MKKGDVGMAKHFSKKYGNKGWAFDYPVSAIWNKFLFSLLKMGHYGTPDQVL